MNNYGMFFFGFMLIAANIIQVVSRWGDNDAKFYLYLGLLLLLVIVMIIRIIKIRRSHAVKK